MLYHRALGRDLRKIVIAVVDNRRPAGRYQLEVPNSLARLSVLLGNRVIFASDGRQVSHSSPDTISLSANQAH